MDNRIEGLMRTTMNSLKEMIDVNTIVGDAVETKDGSIIIPISRVSIGFASGGSEFCRDFKSAENKEDFPFGGGSGAGMAVQPVAFLVVKEDNIKLLPVKQSNTIERIVEEMPDAIDQILDLFKKGKASKNNTAPTTKEDLSQ
jgi:sporulation protein YtfJ